MPMRHEGPRLVMWLITVAMASLRREQKAELLIYDNAIPPLDMPAIRMRGYFWNIWRTLLYVIYV